MWVWLFPMLSGITQSLVQAQSNGVGARMGAAVIISFAVPIGAVWGLLQLFVLAASVYFAGRWIQGRATFIQLRTVIAWAAVPQVVLLAMWLAATAFWGRVLYVDPDFAVPMGGPLFALGLLVLGLTTITAVIWSLIILAKGIAEAQGWSAWKALGNVIVAALMVGVAAMLVALIVVVLT
jgi:hypothetical protein